MSAEQAMSDLKAKVEKESGKILMPHLRAVKNPTYFWLSTTKTGVCVNKLLNDELPWNAFECLLEKLIQSNEKMFRGDTLPQSGYTADDKKFSNTVEGFLATTVYHKKQGDSVTRRSTYYTGILAWANIITIHSANGKETGGSYITLNSEYL